MSDTLNASDGVVVPEPLPEGSEPVSSGETEPQVFSAPPVEGPADAVEAALQAVVKDAKSRGLRTLFQGALASVAATVANVGVSYVHYGDLGHTDWKAAGSAALVAVLASGVAYVQRVSKPKK